MAAMVERPTLDHMWSVLQEKRARTDRLEQQNRQLQAELAAQHGEKSALLARLGRFERQRMSRSGLLKGMGITAAGAVVGGAGLGLDAPSSVLAAGGPGTAASSGFNPKLATTTGYQYQMLSGLEFRPQSSSQGWNAAGNGQTDGISAAAASPIFGDTAYCRSMRGLPQGATVQEILFFVLNNSTQAMYLYFSGVNPSTDSNYEISSASVSRSSSLQTVSLTNLNTVIDNSQSYYRLTWAPSATDSTQILYGARVGYLPPAMGTIKTITPVRVVDTRTGAGGYGNPQPAGSILEFRLSAIFVPAGVPSTATGIIGTLRAYAPSGNGYLTAYPGTGSPPTASNVNFTNGMTVADQVTVGFSANGTDSPAMSIYVGGPSGTSTHVVFDVSGYIV